MKYEERVHQVGTQLTTTQGGCLMKKLVYVVFMVAVVVFFSEVLTENSYAGLKLTGWSYEVDTVNENLKIFEGQSGIDVDDFYNFPSNQYHDKLVTSFVAGTEFDVVYIRDSYVAEWASADWLEPIDGYDGVEEYRKDIPQGAIDQMSYNGKLYGLPYYAGRAVMAYNAKHLEEAGFTEPPKTWDELMEQARAIKEKGIAEAPIMLQFNKSAHIMEAFEQLVFGRGGRLFDEGYAPVFQEEGSVAEQVLTWVEESIEAGVIDPASISSTDHEVVRALGAGTRTFGFLTDYNLKTLNDPESSSQAGHIKMALIPGNDQVRSGTTSLIRFYGITKNSAQKENAWQLVQFLGGKDKSGDYYVGRKWAVKFGLGFVQRPLFDDKEVFESITKWGDPAVLKEQDKYAVARPYRFTPWFQEWQTEAWGELQKAVLGEKDAHQVLVELAKLAKELKESY